MNPFIEYLSSGKLPEARKMKIKAPMYVLKNGVLYKKSYLMPWLRCVGPRLAEYVLKEIHFGSCGDHVGARMLAKKAIRLGYYRPTMYRDAYELVFKCEKCQVHAPIKHVPQMELITIQSAGPGLRFKSRRLVVGTKLILKHQVGLDMKGIYKCSGDPSNRPVFSPLLPFGVRIV